MPHEPSAFARWVAGREPVQRLLDVGCGNGRDALWFARAGYDVTGLDYAASAVELTSGTAAAHGLAARFLQVNLYDADEVTAIASALGDPAPTLVYARFLVHALEDDGRANLWRLTSEVLRDGGVLYVESRVAETEHVFGDHYRHYVPTETIVTELEAAGADVEHCEESNGLAVYKEEDPRVCRVVARWSA